MKYRALGTTGFTVSEIGFGTWGLGGDSYGPVEDRVSREALRAAYDKGINFYDTADLYGAGHSEEILGDALKDVRDRIIIATKVGTLPHTGFYMPQDFSRAYIVNGLEQSLRRLGTDYIDLYQLHSPQDLAEIEKHDVMNTLESLQREGKIRAFGISAKSPADAKTAVEKYGFRTIQVNFNIIDQRAVENGLFALCGENNTGVIARTPLCFGYLTGGLKGTEKFIGRDHRANWPEAQLQRWAEAPGLFDHMMQGKSPAQFALQFCLAHKAVSTTIPGMLTPEQVEENSAAAELEPLTEAELNEIGSIYRNNSFYDPGIKAAAISAEK